jgi:adenosine kinase
LALNLLLALDCRFGKTLREKAEEGGTTVEYMVDPEAPTGTCAVLVTGINRSLVANISAANNYKETHLAEVGWKHVEAAEIFYISGFFLTVSPPSILKVR